MKYKLIIQPPALEDLEEAYDWIRRLWCSRLGCTKARAET